MLNLHLLLPNQGPQTHGTCTWVQVLARFWVRFLALDQTAGVCEAGTTCVQFYCDRKYSVQFYWESKYSVQFYWDEEIHNRSSIHYL